MHIVSGFLQLIIAMFTSSYIRSIGDIDTIDGTFLVYTCYLLRPVFSYPESTITTKNIAVHISPGYKCLEWLNGIKPLLFQNLDEILLIVFTNKTFMNKLV